MSRITLMHDDLGLPTGPATAPLYTTLEEVVAEAGATPVRVIVAGPLTASTSLDVPANITLEFTGEGEIQVGGGLVVNILGHVFAPARQIFTGAGTVTFSSNSCLIFPGWWGGGATGVRIGKLASDQMEVSTLTAGAILADSVNSGTVAATSMSTTGDIRAGNRLTAVEVYEGTRRVGTDRVARAGDTMTGPLYLYAMPENDSEAASRAYVLDIFQSFQSQVDQTNGFGILVIDGTNKIAAESPMDVISMVSGFGLNISKGTPLSIVDDEEPTQIFFVDDEEETVGIGEANGLILAAHEPPGTAALSSGDSIPSSKPMVRISGDGGAVDLSSSPQVLAGSFDGQPLLIVGADDTNTVKLDHGDGLALVGAASITLGKGDSIALRWDQGDTTWREVHRANV